MSNLLVSGSGFVTTTRQSGDDSLRFTLINGGDRFFVEASGAEQCRVVRDAENNGSRLFVVGKLFSFLHRRCTQHHAGIDAIIVLPAPNSDVVSLVEQQLISNQMRNGNGHKIPVLA